MATFCIENQLISVDSLKRNAKKVQWEKADVSQSFRVRMLNEICLSQLPVNPSIFSTTSTTQSVEDDWTVVYLMAFYNGVAIKGEGSVISIWYSVKNDTIFALRSFYTRKKALNWFEYLIDRSRFLKQRL
jgi:hypothetical protein